MKEKKKEVKPGNEPITISPLSVCSWFCLLCSDQDQK
ncbi:hypothetical protein AWRI1631_162350 [Saccharomyces cerevisiae AWRI1631]|uniref:Uncharacterized protein n=1 Tax=Saccharomyces cerevisiae (strain AWRI1631) TaxID=545124 RepID=B5VTD0_YEAS6|nr:hypothetical protein AWRI1631_162350 [Saccharomyces cerevisiae AWRI1631]